MAFAFQSCALLLSSRLYLFSLHNDYPPFLYTMQSIYRAALSFLINWNDKQCTKSSILTIDYKFVPENPSSPAVNTNIRLVRSIKWTLNLIQGVQKIGDWMLYYGCKDLELMCWKIKMLVVVVVLIFLKQNGLCGRLADSNYFYTKELITCTNFCVCQMLFVCTLSAHAHNLWRHVVLCVFCLFTPFLSVLFVLHRKKFY